MSSRTPEDHRTELDYRSFFTKYPHQGNPTDLNTVEKWNFATYIGFERYRAMQTARKHGKAYTKRGEG